MSDITLRPNSAPLATMPPMQLPPHMLAPIGTGAPSQAGTVDIVHVVLRRMWLIVAMGALGTFIGVVVSFLMARYAPSYSAYALLDVIHVGSGSIERPQEPVFGDQLSNFMNTQAVLMQQPIILSEVIRDPTVRETQWFQHAQTSEEPVPDQLRRALNVLPERGTSYLKLTVTTPYRNESHKLANTIMDKYLQYRRNVGAENYLETIAALSTEAARLEREAQEKLNIVNQYLQSVRVAMFEEDDPEVYNRFYHVSRQLLDAQEEAERMQQFVAAYTAENFDQNDAAIRTQIENDPFILRYDATIEEAESEMQRLANRFGPDHDRTRALQQQIESLRVRKLEREDKLFRRYSDVLRRQAQSAYDDAYATYLRIQERYAALQAEVLDFDNKRYQLNKLKDEYNQAQRTAESVKRTLEQIKMDVRDPKLVRVREAARAEPPVTYSSPNWLFNILLGSGLGFAAGLGLALVMESFNRKLRNPDDIRALGLNSLGFLPHVDDEQLPIGDPRLVSQFVPQSVLAEHHRLIRSEVRAKLRTGQIKSILITGPELDDGRTSVACNMAITFAQMGVRVLLIEGNLRRPIFNALFNQSKLVGLSDWLTEAASTPEEIISPTALANLDVITAGNPMPHGCSEHLESGRLRDLVSASTQYDLVLVDGPAALVVADAFVLADQVDGVIFVARADRTTRSMITKLNNRMESHNPNIMGVVLNAVRNRRGDDFKRHYDQFYRYQIAGTQLAGNLSAPQENGNGRG